MCQHKYYNWVQTKLEEHKGKHFMQTSEPKVYKPSLYKLHINFNCVYREREVVSIYIHHIEYIHYTHTLY